MSLLLYSTNVYLKFLIHKQYRNNKHYVWCSETFDARKLGAYSGFPAAPSSDPADIYRRLKEDVSRNDVNSAKISEQKASFKSLAIEWQQKGEISEDQMNEIVYMADEAPFEHWRPLVYVIPRAPVESRLQVVAMARRASFAPEHIIPDLDGSEFDIIEF